MQIGDVLIHRGRAVRLLGHDPMSVSDRRAQIEDLDTGERLDVPYDELEEHAPGPPGFDPAA